MHDTSLFWQVFAAIFWGNLLTVAFVWGIYSYSKLERDGRTRDATKTHAAAIFGPLLFALAGLMIALDKVPAWLDAMAK